MILNTSLTINFFSKIFTNISSSLHCSEFSVCLSNFFLFLPYHSFDKRTSLFYISSLYLNACNLSKLYLMFSFISFSAIKALSCSSYIKSSYYSTLLLLSSLTKLSTFFLLWSISLHDIYVSENQYFSFFYSSQEEYYYPPPPTPLEYFLSKHTNSPSYL